MSMIYAITTQDNPYDPFDQFQQWLSEDARLGHYTTEYLGRIAVYSDELSESDQTRLLTEAIDEILKENPNGPYVKVSREIAA